jgi:ribokinase
VRGREDTHRYAVVVGSANMDLVATTERVPTAGETVTGMDFSTYPGGKGANQAVGVAKLGGRCFLIGKVGDDPFGDSLLASISGAGVEVDRVGRVKDVPTGVAVILVESNGENRIVVVRGANERVLASDVDAAADVISPAAALLVQLEVPLSAVWRAVQIAHEAGARVILDPSPPPSDPFPDSLLEMVDVITPNQLEASVLTGLARVESRSDAELAGRRLLERGVRTAVVKLGADGAVVVSRTREPAIIPGHEVRAVDTTAAGDTFAAALTVGIMEGLDDVEASVFANAAAAISVQRPGAQSSIPTRAEVDTFLSRRPEKHQME